MKMTTFFNDIDSFAEITCEHAEAMKTMFRTIARLTEDTDIKALCVHGELLAMMQGNDIETLQEKAKHSSTLAGNRSH